MRSDYILFVVDILSYPLFLRLTLFSCFNNASMVGGTNQIGYNLGKSVHVLLSQIQEYVFEFNLSHQSQKTESENEVTFRNVSHKTF